MLIKTLYKVVKMSIKKIFLTAIAIASVTACAPIQPTQSNQNTQTKLTLKEVPKISSAEKNLLKNNGFSPGSWSENCSDPNGSVVKYYDEGSKYIADYYEKGKLIRKAEIYSVSQVSPGVIHFKTEGYWIQNNIRYVSNNKTGFIKGKRMTFDFTVMTLDGPGAGNEMVVIRDGFHVAKNKDGNLENTKPALPFIKCN
jgi:hypothetical protein